MPTPRRILRAPRAAVRRLRRLAASRRPTPYGAWLAPRLEALRRTPPPPGAPSFSVLTCVWDGSPEAPLEEAARSVLDEQPGVDVEWVVLDNGCARPALRALLERLGERPGARLVRSGENVGIVPGLRLCLEAATGDVAVPLDADDLLAPGALAAVARALARHGDPPFIYSDEDMLVDGRPAFPYFRPDWDPVLNLCTSYVFHLCAFRREEALALGVYEDPAANWCQDWDTVLRFAAAGRPVAHVPEVLYHWRRHASSSTNRESPEEASLESQRHVLQRFLDARPDGGLFALERFPVDRGVPEWWVRRCREEPDPVSLVVRGGAEAEAEEVAAAAGYPFAAAVGCGRSAEALARAVTALPPGLVAVVGAGVRPAGAEWPWEASGLVRLHPGVALVSGRVADEDGTVLAGGETFGFDGLAGSPERGLSARDPGLYGIALKQRLVSCVHPAFFVADRDVLVRALTTLPAVATEALLGAWIGAAAAREGLLVAFSPLVEAVAEADAVELPVPPEAERDAFLAAHGSLVPDTRVRSPHLPWRRGVAPLT